MKDPYASSIVSALIPMRMIISEAEAVLSELLQRDFTMSLTDFNILTAVDIMGTCTQVEVARFNQVTEAAISKRISTLVDAGYVSRATAATDQRSTVLTLTQAGKEHKCAVVEKIAARMEDVFADFPEAKRTEVQNLLLAMFPMVLAESPRREILLKSQHPIITKLLNSEGGPYTCD